jgi:hypothetical protein
MMRCPITPLRSPASRVNDSARNQPNGIEIVQAIVGTIDQIIKDNVVARLVV